MPYKPGDILFFTVPPQPRGFAKIAMRAQTVLSLFTCTCCSEDYKKTHVAVCTAVSEDKLGNQEVTITHFNSDTYKYEQKSLSELSSSIRDRRIDALRPTNSEFAKSLVKTVTSDEAKSIKLDDDSMQRSLLCCTCTTSEKTNSGFSMRSHCSRFVAEAIDITSGNPNGDYFDYSFNGANVTVMRLWQRLTATKLYEHIAPQSAEAKHDARSDLFAEKQAFLFRA